jgi:hypothetical protein
VILKFILSNRLDSGVRFSLLLGGGFLDQDIKLLQILQLRDIAPTSWISPADYAVQPVGLVGKSPD